MSTSKSYRSYRHIGDVLNYSSIALNLGMTAMAMLGLPSRSAYDSWWTANGFCVNEADSRSFDTEVLCCLVLVTSAVTTQLFLNQLLKNKSNQSSLDPQLQSKLEGSVLANAAHGIGHLFVYFSPGPPPPILLEKDPLAVANIVMLICFWVGVLRAVVLSIPNNSAAFFLAVIILTAQYLLKVPPNFSFTYSQSIILLAGSADQLFLPRERRGSFVYALIAATYLPTLFLYGLEMTQCSGILAPIGGHGVYDTYLACLPFFLYFAVKQHEGYKRKTS